MTTAMTDFIPPVQLEVDGAPRVAMVDAIRQTLIDFCTRTKYWRYECDALVTVADIAEYALDIPVQTECVSVRTLSFNGDPLTEKNMDWLDENQPGWRALTGTPHYYCMRDPNTILLDRLPVADLEIAATVALAPSQTATTCDDILIEQCRDAIAKGAIARLKGMTGKPWTDDVGEAKRMAEYERSVIDFRDRASKAFGTRNIRRVRASFL